VLVATAFRNPPLIFLALWSAAITALVVPWQTFQNHPHWARIRWVPFLSAPVTARDIVGNVLLYMPFGYFVNLSSRHHRWLVCVSAAVFLSCSTEATQIFAHSRFPSVQDVLMNVLGAAIGAGGGELRRRQQ
jgi:glycopeptide antibiotics resistance protein